MRKLLTLIMLMFTTLAFSQRKEIDYPRYEVDSLGQKVVVITVRQAMILDNNSDLLILLKKQVVEMNEYEDICVKVINDKEVVRKYVERKNLRKIDSDINIFWF